jgi:glycosyltransferase involved in cell wall biosynthesis
MAAPAFWPAVAFGGPVPVARTLTAGLAARGHQVEVVTTTLLDPERGRSQRSRTELVDGVRVHYLATPLRYRWMGITPTLPWWLARRARPDVVHVFGFRDVVTTVTSWWCRAARVPYVFEALGMAEPRLRNVPAKRLFDATLARGLVGGAAGVVVVSERERRMLVAHGTPAERIHVRPNPFPPVRDGRTGALRKQLGLRDEPLVLYVGRLAPGKGIDLLVDAVAALDGVHLALVGPEEGGAAARARATGGRVHVLEPLADPHALYGDADVFVLASEGESFGNVAAEAAAAGVPVVVTDRCGVAELLGPEGALVVPYGLDAIRGAVARVLGDRELARRLGDGGRRVAARHSAEALVELQERIYRAALGAA